MNQPQVNALLNRVHETNQIISNLKAVRGEEFKDSKAGSKTIDRAITLLKKGQN